MAQHTLGQKKMTANTVILKPLKTAAFVQFYCATLEMGSLNTS
jgi:hypothetical protein